MTKNYKHIILSLWFGLLWASPAMASFADSNNSNNELFSTHVSTSVTLALAGDLHLSGPKANIILGKWNPNAIEGVSNQLGTDDVIGGLTIFKNYSFADDVLELGPGSIHLLNIPEGMYVPEAFFHDFNLDFLDMVIKNKGEVEIILATKPSHADLFKAWSRGKNGFDLNLDTGLIQPSSFAKEIKYLRENGVKKVKYKDGSVIDLENIDLDSIGLDWETKWN